MQILYFLFFSVQAIVGVHLIFPLILYGIYRFEKARATEEMHASGSNEADYTIIVTAYQQTHQLPPS